MKFIKSFLLALFIAFIISLLIVGGFFRRIEGTQIDKEALLWNTKPTTVYDAHDKPIARFYNDRRSLATFKETPKEIHDSILSTEDRDFYNHAGMSVKAITRAAVQIVRAKGEIVQGGSTLSQQLIKNTHLDASQSFERKFNEIVYATVLEKDFTKEEIFEMYINDVEFAWRAFGVKDALMTYFGDTFETFNLLPREDRIAKASLITAMLKSPTQYDPYRQSEKALKRRNEVIHNMLETKKITAEEYELAINKPLLVLEKPKLVFEEETVQYQELVHHALFETSKKMNMSIEDVIKSGYDIHTSFNTDIYKIIRKKYENNKNFPDNAKDGTPVESSSVYVNPKNGEIIAFTGGRKELKPEEFLGYNRAFMLKKQPGSTIKPVIAYGPALESGKFSPYSSLVDAKGHVFPGGYVVKDWDGGGRGSVTMKEAIRQSWNIPAVWTLQQTGMGYAKEYAKKLGLNLDEENTLGIALGGLVGGVSPLEMADSYQAFANEGIRNPAHSVRYIKNSAKEEIYKAYRTNKPTIDPQNARDMKDMLRNVIENGTARRASISGRKIAGKTGTVEHPLVKGKANSDIWFVGFDENLVGATWMGYDKVSKERTLTTGSGFAATFWSDLTSDILDYLEKHGGIDDPKELELTEAPDNEAPTITLNGETSVTLEYGEVYSELGAKAVDDTDGDVTENIQITGNVEGTKPGTYTITYTVSDSFNNKATSSRTVIVKEKPKPVVQINLTTEGYDNNKSIYITWDAVEGDVVFSLYKNGTLLQELQTNSYLDSSVVKGKRYEYQVIGKYKDTGDRAARSSVISAELIVDAAETPPAEKPSTESPVEKPKTESPVVKEPVKEQPSSETKPEGQTPNSQDKPSQQNDGTSRSTN